MEHKAPIQIKWFIAHQPAYLFVRTAKAFQRTLDEMLPGEFEVEILTTAEYIRKYNDIDGLERRLASVPGLTTWENSSGSKNNEFQPAFRESDQVGIKSKWTNFFNALTENKFQMTQTQVTLIGSYVKKEFLTLDLPFLFKDHDHVTKTLGGKIGDELCEMLVPEGVRGLGFTYSGGYRVIGSNHEIKNLAELQGTKLLTVPYTNRFFEDVGADTSIGFDASPVENKMVADNDGAVETTYLRFAGSHVLKTNHSMFLTTVMISEQFWQSLNEKQQAVFKEAVDICSKLERKWSIDDANEYERTAAERGITITDLPAQDAVELASRTDRQYSTALRNLPRADDIIKQIQAAA
jgi:TRAP-type C4-dicarboxylate transport system substrate-binding protein